MNPIDALVPQIRAFRPFLPAEDYNRSLRFYQTLGFRVYPLGETLAELSLGAHAFLLQKYYVKAWADNMMMHVLVEDVQAWWKHIGALNLVEQFGIPAPAAPRAEPWGLTVLYLVDPSGILWHFAQES